LQIADCKLEDRNVVFQFAICNLQSEIEGALMEPKRAYAGRPRRRQTRRSVRVAEALARLFVTVGGIGTIVAVVGVFVFLLSVVIPLFQSAAVQGETRAKVPWAAAPVGMGVDEDQTIAWALFPDGGLQVVHLEDGRLLEKRPLFEGAKLTAWSFSPGGEEAAFGFADGSVRTGKIRFTTRFVGAEDLPADVRQLPPRKRAVLEKGVVTRTDQGLFRVTELEAELKPPVKGASRSPVVLLDRSKTTRGAAVAVLTADRKLRLSTVTERQIEGIDEVVLKVSGRDVPYVEPSGKGPPAFLFLAATGDQVFLFWKDGHLLRLDARDPDHPRQVEERNLLGDPSRQVTAVRTLIGKATYLVGDSSGRVRAWYHANPAEPDAGHAGKMVRGHEFAGSGAAVTALATSDRSRLAAAATADGAVRLLYVTSDRVVGELATHGDGAARALALAPKDDGLVGAAGGLWHWKFDPRHPEATLRSLFAKVWYEGYDRPQHMWQSSAMTDASEPKYGLMPLIFGTLKAAFYSLLFGVPLALLAAVYTSEFLSPRARNVIKPTVELMASLPSVVLGFLAGLVLAQFLEGVLPAFLACLVTVPLAFLAAAYLWQMLPEKLGLVLGRSRFLLILGVLPLGLLAGVGLGPVLEGLLFGGDLRAWLDRGEGSGAAGWVFLLLPLAAVVCVLLLSRWLNPLLRRRTAAWGRGAAALLELGKFVLGCALTFALAWAAAEGLGQVGMDPRTSFFGPYSQRNTMIAALAMGFAIIPIIYTIAEDALSAVPDHLRAGSLAAGATRWQTATRIIIPTAMSGLFSAVMIGLGRAVGETMIVLMATGNTPVMDWNIFSGCRTLSANIAVEMGEAVQGSTHFRILFLSALVLFAFTFVLNSLAELVRQRFRRRAYQL
jgi:phosphate transport system permease protein